MEIGVWGLGIVVWSLWFGVWGLRFGVWGSGAGGKGLGFEASGFYRNGVDRDHTTLVRSRIPALSRLEPNLFFRFSISVSRFWGWLGSPFFGLYINNIQKIQ